MVIQKPEQRDSLRSICREAGPLSEPMLDHRAEEELQAELDDGDDPVARAEDGFEPPAAPQPKREDALEQVNTLPKVLPLSNWLILVKGSHCYSSQGSNQE